MTNSTAVAQAQSGAATSGSSPKTSRAAARTALTVSGSAPSKRSVTSAALPGSASRFTARAASTSNTSVASDTVQASGPE